MNEEIRERITRAIEDLAHYQEFVDSEIKQEMANNIEDLEWLKETLFKNGVKDE